MSIFLDKIQVVFILFNSAIAWQLIYSTFGNQYISSDDLSGWEFSQSSTIPQLKTCNTSDFQLIAISGTSKQVLKIINDITPHYSIKSVQDIYFYFSFNNEYAEFYMDNQQIFYKQLDYLTNMNYFSNVCVLRYSPSTVNVYTIIGILNPHPQNNLELLYITNLNQGIENEAVLIRNVQVYLKPCFQTCLTCIGPLINECLTCHYQSPISGYCNYCNDSSFLFTHPLLGCIQECPEGYLADNNNFCVDKENSFRILQVYQGTSFSDQGFYLQKQNYPGTSIFPAIQICNSQAVAGYFSNVDSLQKVIILPYGSSFLRLRATIYFFNNWTNQESIQIKINQNQRAYLIYNSGNIEIQNGKILHNSLNQACNTITYDLIRIECDISSAEMTQQILIEFQASLGQNSISTWGIRDVTVDVMVCSFNCYLCENQYNCKTCEIGFKLHKGQCVQVCPTYSTDMGTTCKDFDEETAMTAYEVKAFYDLSTDDETANNMFTLVSENPPNFAKGASIYFSYLINKRIFGGTLVWRNAKFQKIISISKPHYGIRIRMNVILGDDFAGGSFIYSINSVATTLTRSTPGGIDEQIWAGVENEYQLQVDTYKIDNDFNGSYQFEVECLSSKDINMASCGISDLFITVYRCPFQCADCDDEFTCHSYLGSVNYNSLTGTCSDGYYKDYANNDCVQCQLTNCLKCNDQNTCIECDSTFTLSTSSRCVCLSNQVLVLGQCVDCHSQCKTCTSNSIMSCLSCKEEQNRYLVNSECVCLPHFQSTNGSDECSPICGDMVVVGNEECDDGNQSRFDGCHMCRYECQQECRDCHFGLCYKCAMGFSLNTIIHKCFQDQEIHFEYLVSLNRRDVNKQNVDCNDASLDLSEACKSCQFSYDKINESCRKGNLINQRKLKIYDFSTPSSIQNCPTNCSTCAFEICIQCKFGYRLENNICILDIGLMTNRQDVSVNNDIFNIANSQCSDNCSFCSMGSCLQCLIGWHLSSITGQCESICGDGLVVGLELCDDGNDEPYDGCYLCQYQCQQECEYCFLGICQECVQGWSLRNSICSAICGDRVVNGNEQCDDGNGIPYDGCFECKFQCDQRCLNCVEGLCVECEVGYLQEKAVCSSICGDGQMAIGVEECDDGNMQDGDGCSSECLIEEGWSCASGQQHCEISCAPLMYLDVVEDGKEKKKVQIKFTQKLIKSGVETQFSLSLNSNELSDDDVQEMEQQIIHTIEVEPLKTADYLVFRDVIYEVTITFIKNCFKSELVVELIDQKSLINNLKQPISNSIAKAKLKQTNFLNETQKQASEAVGNTINSVFYGLLILFGISVLCGNLNILWNTLDLLQFLSYLKYINVPFPINLQYFFELFDQVTFGPILDITGFRQFMSLFLGSETPYIQPSTRFEDINALLVENIQSLIFIISVGYAFHYLQVVLLRVLAKIELSLYLKSKQLVLVKIMLFIKSELKQEIKAFYFSELIRLFLSSSYELYFAIYLQIGNLHFQNVILSINSVMSILLLIIVSLINIHLLFSSNDYLAKHNKSLLQRKVQSLFEDISIHSYLSRMFNSLFLIKRNIFMLILVFLQNTPLPQTFLVGITSGLFMIYLVMQHPQNNKYNQFNILMTEIVVQLCCFIFMLFEINNHYTQLFDFTMYLNLGWVCIALISGCLVCQFALDLYQQILILKAKFEQAANQIYQKIENKKTFKLCESTNQECQIQLF